MTRSPTTPRGEGTTLATLRTATPGRGFDGTARFRPPGHRDLPDTCQGNLWTLFGSGDADTGTLTRDEFTVSRPGHINCAPPAASTPHPEVRTGDNGGGKLLAGFDGS